MTYETAQSMLPPGYRLWGNFGDGKWRISDGLWDSVIAPAVSIDDAIRQWERATDTQEQANG